MIGVESGVGAVVLFRLWWLLRLGVMDGCWLHQQLARTQSISTKGEVAHIYLFSQYNSALRVWQ